MAVLATWYYEQDVDEGGTYAQVRAQSHSEAFRDVYRRCIEFHFRTARQANPDADLVLYLNRPWRSGATREARQVDAKLDRLGVTRVVLPYHFAPPGHWKGAWRNQFFVFDVLGDLIERTAEGDFLAIADSDTVWTSTARARELARTVLDVGSATTALGYPEGHSINGSSQRDLADYARLRQIGHATTTIEYVGGEFLAFRRDVARSVFDEASRLWPLIKRDSERGLAVVNEEAHLLSLVAHGIELPPATNRECRRIWTRVLQPRNTNSDDRRLTLLHLPAEKRLGIPRALRRARKRDGLSYSGTHMPEWELSARDYRTLGVGRLRPSKALLDLAALSASRIKILG